MPEKESEIKVEELALRAKMGDREARNCLYLHLDGRVSRCIYPARRLVARMAATAGGSIAPEDVTQQAFVIFCDLLEEWEPVRSPFVPYMMKMIRLRAYHYVRACLHSRSTQAEHQVPAVEEEAIDSELTIELVEGSDLWNRLVACLDADRKRMLALKYHRDLSSRQIACITGKSPAYVNRYLQTTLRLLRGRAEEEWEAL